MRFYDKYIWLCNSINKSPSAVAIELEIGKPSVTRWKRGAEPRDSTKLRVANYFGITVEELMSGVEDAKKDPAQKSEVKALVEDLPENIQQLIRICLDRPDLARALLSVAQQIENDPSGRE